MISIGAIYHGPELRGSPINVEIMKVATAITNVRGPLEKGGQPWVNAVFVVSGSLRRVEFDGLEYGEYSKKDNGVVVKIAVPSRIQSSGDTKEFVVQSLRGVNAMAFEFFRQKGETFALSRAEELIDKVSGSM